MTSHCGNKKKVGMKTNKKLMSSTFKRAAAVRELVTPPRVINYPSMHRIRRFRDCPSPQNILRVGTQMNRANKQIHICVRRVAKNTSGRELFIGECVGKGGIIRKANLKTPMQIINYTQLNFSTDSANKQIMN